RNRLSKVAAYYTNNRPARRVPVRSVCRRRDGPSSSRPSLPSPRHRRKTNGAVILSSRGGVGAAARFGRHVKESGSGTEAASRYRSDLDDDDPSSTGTVARANATIGSPKSEWDKTAAQCNRLRAKEHGCCYVGKP
ncbi:hypothetical protein THAOC_17846, partial [Thalassiosira oceanica]